MFHPHARAFWQPFADGLLGMLIFGTAGGLIGSSDPWGGATILGAVGLLLFYFYSYFYWRDILRRSYTDDLPSVILPSPEVEVLPPVYRTLSADKKTWQIIEGLPCSVSQLGWFAQGMSHEPPVPTTYAAWLSVFSQPEFSLFREWLLENKFVRPTKRGEVELTVWGADFFHNVHERGVQLHEPLPGPSKFEDLQGL